MAEANHRLQQTTDRTQPHTMIAAIMTLAHRNAREAVKLELRAKALKLAQFSDATWAVDAAGAWRTSRVRKALDPGAH